MVKVTLEEFKENVDKYLHQKEKTYVVEGNKVLAIISPAKGTIKKSFKELSKEIQELTQGWDMDLEEIEARRFTL